MCLKMTNVRLINHSSVLIQEGNEFVLTDPWFESPAFGSWFPVPPTSIPPAYLVALSKSVENFFIAISHGHDDHLDDKFLSLFPKETVVVIPKYKSRGLLSRLKRIGFTNILEAPPTGIKVGLFNIKSYINMEISRDDAILTIETPNSFIVHANDNWQEIQGQNFASIKEDAGKFGPEKTLYMSQCNLADGFPNIYEEYTEKEKVEIHNRRVDNIIKGSLMNAHNIGAGFFLNYAGYASAFVKDKPQLKNHCSFVTNEHVAKIQSSHGYKTEVVGMIPGDCFNFSSVSEMFAGVKLDPAYVKECSYDFYENYSKILNCDTYKDYSALSDTDIQQGMQTFLDSFSTFVEKRLEPTNFNTDIAGFEIIFACPEANLSSSTIVGEQDFFDGRRATFSTTKSVMSQIIAGAINWENLYIGYAATVKAEPKNTNIRSVVRWLAMYGYVYQRDTIYG